MGFGVGQAWTEILAFLLSSYVTSDNWLIFLNIRLLFWQTQSYAKESLSELNEAMHINALLI